MARKFCLVLENINLISVSTRTTEDDDDEKKKRKLSAFYPHNEKTMFVISSRIFTPDGVNAC